MNRSRRTNILCRGSKGLRDSLSAEIARTHRILEIEAPDRGLVMVKMREAARHGLFYLGDLLVTEARVQVEGAVGIGIIAGDEEEAAFSLAVIDAACNGEFPETSAWDDLLIAEERRLESEVLAADRRVLETKVDFQTMDQEPE